MKFSRTCCVLIAVAAFVAIVLRMPQLEQRPMHGDEAVHAEKFGTLLEEGTYSYDPDEYHGPTLNYLTLIPAGLAGVANYTDVSEFALRIVPVFFGVLLVLLFLFSTDGLGWAGAICGALLTAVSPAMIFYSRYYIQEMLLVCFGFGVIVCGWRYTQNKSIVWSVLAGVFCGLAYATKETCIIAFGCMIIAVVVLRMIDSGPGPGVRSFSKAVKPSHALAGVVAAGLVAVIFYSSFFSNPRGVIDSILAYKVYFSRAGQNPIHNHPWYYYLKLLLYHKYASGPVFTEAFIILLAVVGFVVAITKKVLTAVSFTLVRFVAVYTLAMILIYSVIPYKTPWCMLGFLHGMIILAGVGAAALLRLAGGIPGRIAVIILLAAGAGHLGWQGYLGSYKYYTDSRNPYVYAHPLPDVFQMVKRIEDIAAAHPDGYDMTIHVICPKDDYWPLPWYLREFAKVGYWGHVDDSVPAASVIIASPAVEAEIMRKLYELPKPGEKQLYMPLFESHMQLRPQIELRGYVTKDLLDSYLQQRSK